MREAIDELIKERAGWMYRGGRLVRPVRGGLHLLLGYDRTVEIAESFRDVPAAQIMDTMAEMIAHRVAIEGLENIPDDGAAIVVCNHPTGIADGIVLWSLLRKKRPDLFFFANRDVLRILPQMSDMIAPVEWREGRRSHSANRETLVYARGAFREGRLGVIFPSGRLAKRRGLRLHERPWMHSAAVLARKMELPVVPLRMTARNSALFYAFDALHATLRDITLFHEVLNKSTQPYAVKAGHALEGKHLPTDPDEATEKLRRAMHRLRDPIAEQELVIPARYRLLRTLPARLPG